MSDAKRPVSYRINEAYDLAESVRVGPQQSSDRELIALLSGKCTVDHRWCQSPVETAMLDAFLECGLNTDRSRFRTSGRTTLFQQLHFSSNDGEFFLDFALMRPVGGHVIRVAVEIDGFNVHHGSVEAVDKDNRRTRALAKRGWMVIRYSGSEVTRDAGRCAIEAVAVVIENVDLLANGNKR